MRKKKRNQNIVISDQEPGLPFSKGLMASQVMVTGLTPYRAYEVAERIEDYLVEHQFASVTRQELRDVAIQVLEEVAGDRYAKNFIRWQDVADLDVPLVILIGGATGVGKSTIATKVADRLDIVRVVATDSIREVMRALFSRELMPTLHTSSFDADSALREPPPRPADKVIVGFREQTTAVAVGVHALIERAAVESTRQSSTVIEGAHVVPGFVETADLEDFVAPIPMVISVEDEDVHRSHFTARTMDSSRRPFDRYLASFGNIRKVQRYIKSQALSHGWPIVPSYDLDQTIADVIDLVVERATEWAAAHRPATEPMRVPELEGGIPL
jgi:2-phosphoglycerate kinase